MAPRDLAAFSGSDILMPQLDTDDRSLQAGPADDETRWQEVDLQDATIRQRLIEELARVSSTFDGTMLVHDPAWLFEADGRTSRDVRVFLLRRHGVIVGYAPLLIQPWSLAFRLGERPILSSAFVRLHLNGEPLLARSIPADARVAAMVQLMKQLRTLIGPREVLSLEGVRCEGAADLAVATKTVRSDYVVLQPSPRYERALIRLPSDFDVYMGSMKPQTRQNLRSSQRKLERHLDGNLRLLSFSSAEHVSDFVAGAVAISRRTYQWHLLGLGLREPERLTDTLRAMARHGWTRCYLLECAGVPTAFMIGYLYSGTYYYVDVGFDPDWERWSVGTVLHLMVVRDLIEADPRVTWFDFSSGTGVHKKRFSNVRREEWSHVLFPRRRRNILLVHAYRANDALSTSLVRLLDRLHLKAAVKRLIRRAAVARSKQE